jgi:uncharacterized protein YraI
MRRSISLAIACVLAGSSAAAFADDGYVTSNVTMYSGPDASYPAVETIPAGEPVAIEGCEDGYGWCDVIWGQDRGWIAGGYIQYNYDNQPVLLQSYGAAIGIPIVTFAIADYWGRYYSGRPFFAQRDRWFNRPMPHRPPPPAFRGPLHDFAHGPVREAVHTPGRPAMGYPPHQQQAPGGHPEYRNAPINRGPENRGPENHAPPQHQQPARQAPAPRGGGEEHHDEHGH